MKPENEPIPPEVLTDIGRLIRGCAELEFSLDLYLMKLLHLNFDRYSRLMKGVSFKRKSDVAADLAHADGEAEEKALRSVLKADGLEALLECRNAVAHGIYLGVIRSASHGPDLYMFVSLRDWRSSGKKVGNWAVSYDHLSIRTRAEKLETSIPIMRDVLGVSEFLTEWRESSRLKRRTS
jgi:hypothetical protein